MNPLKSHLFWFVVAGAALFAVDSLRNDNDRIIVDTAVAQRMASLWLGQMGREPTADELANLLQNWVEEEMMFREATRLDLDTDDVIIRRRLVQKVDFIAEEGVSESPDEAALREYFNANIDTYLMPARYSFSQLQFRTSLDATAARAQLAAGANPDDLGEPGMLSPVWSVQTPLDVASAFGNTFAHQLSGLKASPDWQGPLQSEFGWHLVLVDQRLEPGQPELREVRGRVLTDYLYDARSRARKKFLAGLQDRYQVEWRLEQP